MGLVGALGVAATGQAQPAGPLTNISVNFATGSVQADDEAGFCGDSVYLQYRFATSGAIAKSDT